MCTKAVCCGVRLSDGSIFYSKLANIYSLFIYQKGKIRLISATFSAHFKRLNIWTQTWKSGKEPYSFWRTRRSKPGQESKYPEEKLNKTALNSQHKTTT